MGRERGRGGKSRFENPRPLAIRLLGEGGPGVRRWKTTVGRMALVAATTAAFALALRAQQKPADAVQSALVWPQPPDPPRIRYLQSFGRASDFGWKRSLWRKFLDWAKSETDPSLLVRPVSIAVDGRGRLIVADEGAGDVKIFDLQKKSVKVIRGYKGKEFGTPVGVAVDDADNLYISDASAGRVLEYSPDGKFRAFIGGEEGAFKRPASIVFNPANHLLYVADTQRPRIFAYTTEGKEVKAFGEAGSGPGQFNLPTFLTVDREGRLYVNDTMNCRVQVFTPDGKFVAQFGEAGDGSGYFNRPKGVAVDSEGHIYVAEALFSTVQIFDLQGRYLLSFGEAGRNVGEFYIPAGVAIDGSDRIYVADPFQRRIQVFQYLAQKSERAEAPGGGR
jgi:DNA-binding beta-propeller fold protein YncE